jgi:hypothetical protein
MARRAAGPGGVAPGGAAYSGGARRRSRTVIAGQEAAARRRSSARARSASSTTRTRCRRVAAWADAVDGSAPEGSRAAAGARAGRLRLDRRRCGLRWRRLPTRPARGLRARRAGVCVRAEAALVADWTAGPSADRSRVAGGSPAPSEGPRFPFRRRTGSMVADRRPNALQGRSRVARRWPGLHRTEGTFRAARRPDELCQEPQFGE